MMRSTAWRTASRTATLLVATLAFAIVWLCLESSAHADGAILFVGKVEPRERGVIKAAIVDTAKQLGWTFDERTFPDDERDDVLACLELDRPATCIEGFFRTNRIDKLSVVQVATERPRNGKADIIVTQQVVAPGAGAVFIQRRTCEQCDDGTLRQHVTAMTKKLLEDVESGTRKTILAIKTTPPGAWITLDGDSVGASDSTLATFPGKHTLMLRANGYETEVRDITAVEGKTTELTVTMRPTTGPSSREPVIPVPTPSRALPRVLIGAGAASLLAGGILIAIDQDPDASPDAPFEIRNTAPTGVEFAVAGAVAVGIGVYLVVRSGRAPAQASRPTATVSPEAVSVGWEVRF